MTSHPNRSRAKDRPGRNPAPDEIRAARESVQLTQEQAARLCYASLASYRDWEQGRRRMHPAIWAWYQCALIEHANPHIARARQAGGLPPIPEVS